MTEGEGVDIKVIRIPEFGENETLAYRLLIRIMLLKSIMENKTLHFKISY